MVDTTDVGRETIVEQTPALLAENPDVLREALFAKRNRLLESIKAIDIEIAEIQEEMKRKSEEAQKRRQPLENALSHLDAFLHIEGWLPATQDSAVDIPSQSTNSKTAADAAHELLTSLGQPMHYRELAQRLAEKRVVLAGKDPAATLLSQMTRDDRFKRSGQRGVYGLTSWKMRRTPRGRGKSKSRLKTAKGR